MAESGGSEDIPRVSFEGVIEDPASAAVQSESAESLSENAQTLEAALHDVDPSVAAVLGAETPTRPRSRAVRSRGRYGAAQEEEAEEEEEEEEGEDEEEEEGSDVNPLFLNGAICLGKGVGAALSGAVMGGIWGVGSGLFKREGFKVALAEGGKSAKTFALLGGVHSAVTCSLESLRGGRDAWHAGVAGCATGLVMGAEGGLQSALQSCAGFGVFSYLVENLQPPATAATVAGPQLGRRHLTTWHVDRLAHSEFPVTPLFLEPVVRPVRTFHKRLKTAESRRVKEAIRRELRK